MTELGSFSRAREPDDQRLSVDGTLRPPEPYEMPKGAEEAVDVALLLGRPLLVTGAPGIGKTRLGWAVARRLGIQRGYHFFARSTSEARDLFYNYDALQRFRDATQPSASGSVIDYIRYQALGAAILDGSEETSEVTPFVKGASWTRDSGVKRALVVVDELDKAPRDFANDLLVEFENMTFQVPELGSGRVPRPAPDRMPVVIVTSNSERDLPDAFLRRCVYLHLDYPSVDELAKILRLHVAKVRGAPPDEEEENRIQRVAELTTTAQQGGRMRKSPGTAEAVDAVKVMIGRNQGQLLPLDRAWLHARRALAKTLEDLKEMDNLILTTQNIDLAGVTSR